MNFAIIHLQPINPISDMRNLSRHAGPNRMMFLLLIPCLLLSALRAKAEETALPEGKRPG